MTKLSFHESGEWEAGTPDSNVEIDFDWDIPDDARAEIVEVLKEALLSMCLPSGLAQWDDECIGCGKKKDCGDKLCYGSGSFDFHAYEEANPSKTVTLDEELLLTKKDNDDYQNVTEKK